MSIHYSKKKKYKAGFIQGVHKRIQDKLNENEEYKQNVDTHKHKIHSKIKHLTFNDLRNMNNVGKKAVRVEHVLKQDDLTRIRLEHANKKLKQSA